MWRTSQLFFEIEIWHDAVMKERDLSFLMRIAIWSVLFAIRSYWLWHLRFIFAHFENKFFTKQMLIAKYQTAACFFFQNLNSNKNCVFTVFYSYQAHKNKNAHEKITVDTRKKWNSDNDHTMLVMHFSAKILLYSTAILNINNFCLKRNQNTTTFVIWSSQKDQKNLSEASNIWVLLCIPQNCMPISRQGSVKFAHFCSIQQNFAKKSIQPWHKHKMHRFSTSGEEIQTDLSRIHLQSKTKSLARTTFSIFLLSCGNVWVFLIKINYVFAFKSNFSCLSWIARLELDTWIGSKSEMTICWDLTSLQ